VFVQLIAPELAVSFTFPAPVTVRFTVPPPEVNSASTASAADMPTTQLTLLLDKQKGMVPLQPKNAEPALAADVKVTIVPAGKFDVQVPLAVAPVKVQLIPAGALVIVPAPV
jgi:hypothetical protein